MLWGGSNCQAPARSPSLLSRPLCCLRRCRTQLPCRYSLQHRPRHEWMQICNVKWSNLTCLSPLPLPFGFRVQGTNLQQKLARSHLPCAAILSYKRCSRGLSRSSLSSILFSLSDMDCFPTRPSIRMSLVLRRQNTRRTFRIRISAAGSLSRIGLSTSLRVL